MMNVAMVTLYLFSLVSLSLTCRILKITMTFLSISVLNYFVFGLFFICM